jgi:asparagine synthase (glutamine-hydrolysing)
MSVLAGIFDRGTANPLSGRIHAMLGPFRQRGLACGPVIDDGTCSLAVAGGGLSNPMERPSYCHESSDVCVIIDGRIDRTSWLRSNLDVPAEVTAGALIAAAYRRFGTEMFGHLRGDFAIVVWDRKDNKLVAARDLFGIRPLYYVASAQRVAVASDPEQMLAARLASTSVDRDMVLDYLLWDGRFSDRTFFQEIKNLPGGHMLVATQDRSDVRRFAVPFFAGSRLNSREEYWTEYRRRFFHAVSTCIRSDKPAVLELSGGLDSSSIVCAADRIFAENSHLCPALVGAAGQYPGLPCDETPFIEAVAEHIHIPIKYWDATQNSVNELEPSSIALPGARYSTFAGTEGQLDIMREYGSTVLISGMGGDQIGISSGAIRDAVTDRRWSEAARMIFDWPGANAKFTRGIGWALARSFIPSVVRNISNKYGPVGPRPFWLSGWAKAHRRIRPLQDYPPGLRAEIHRRNWRSLNSGLHSLAMAYLQHHAVRSNIEIRFPFLDLDLVSTAFSIPARYWPPPWPCERLHREILGDLLPVKVAQRRTKANFQSALRLRIQRHISEIRDMFLSGPWVSVDFVDRDGALRLLGTFERLDTPDLSTIYGLWAVATLEAWMREILRYAPPRNKV